ncbi:MAG: IS66 family insertion sequence element accessory protein TnpB [Planctomycetales bacterium]|nr:IS66 family insertion sequence element accessory protein TnpB [Planctomycetales bacterium]
MIQLTPHMRIWVCIEPVDFRKGIDGLARLCLEQLEQDPFSGYVFAFRNRRATAIKVLVYDGQGFWLCQKRISQGKFHWWPRGEAAAHEIAANQLQILICAGNPERVDTPPDWRPLTEFAARAT